MPFLVRKEGASKKKDDATRVENICALLGSILTEDLVLFGRVLLMLYFNG